jgi:hypothetical protein
VNVSGNAWPKEGGWNYRNKAQRQIKNGEHCENENILIERETAGGFT